MKRLETAISITDPLVKYNSLIATGTLHPDSAQHRLAYQLQKLYFRLKDYQPPAQYRTRLRQMTKTIGGAKENESDQLAARSHPIRSNPLLARFFRSTGGARDTLAVTRVLTSYEAARDLDSPRGLFLSGEVGTGKSMLLDLLANGLPTSRKRRWHFNTFMLNTFSRLEEFRELQADGRSQEQEWSLLWMAKEMIEKSPILFLDEFQLPDRAASKMLSNLFIAFFQLGGVLIASSNRMPDELEKAMGSYGSPPSVTRGLVRNLFGMTSQQPGRELFRSSSGLAGFLAVLQARCDFWHMEGAQDWRRRDVQEHLGNQQEAAAEQIIVRDESGREQTASGAPLILVRDDIGDSTTPRKYALAVDDQMIWDQMICETMNMKQPMTSPVPWDSATLVVYGRAVRVPKQYQGVAYWDFDELVCAFGPADYITLASNYHTFIIDKVPVLPVSMKNEARRFITLLDALYEAKCKVLIRAQVGPDNLFFPEQKRRKEESKNRPVAATRSKVGRDPEPAQHDEDVTYSETVSEVFQDSAAPFRPNIASYDVGPSSSSKPSSIHAELDSDFGISGQKVDFVNTSAFTGEDERFAYRRAASRLWEICSASWHARPGPPESWWQPLPVEARHWESKQAKRPLDRSYATQSKTTCDVAWGPSLALEEPAGLSRFRVDDMKRAGDE